MKSMCLAHFASIPTLLVLICAGCGNLANSPNEEQEAQDSGAPRQDPPGEGVVASDVPFRVDGPPRLVGAVSTGNRSVRVSFSESMDVELALDESNYSIAQANVNSEAGALAIISAQLSDDWATVDLTTAPQNEVTYELIVVNLQDLEEEVLAAPEPLNDTVRTQFFGTPQSGTGDDSDCDGLTDAVEQSGWIVTVEDSAGTITQQGVTSDWLDGICPNDGKNQDPDDTQNLFWDTDNDGLDDLLERSIGSNPRSADTDGDRLRDDEEFLVWFSSVVDQDSDDDGISDYAEVNLFKTSPIMEDTDGDGLDDAAEQFELGRNPRIADVPEFQVRLGELRLELNRIFTYTDSEGQQQEQTISGSSSLQQSEESRTSFQSTKTSEFSFGFTQSLSTSVKAGLPPGVEVNAGFESRQNSSRGQSVGFTRDSAQSTARATEQSRADAQQFRSENSVTAELREAKVVGDVTLENVGDIAFSITNLELSLLTTDPTNRSQFIPIATLLPESQLISGDVPQFNLGPLAPVKGPLVFSNRDVFPQEVEELMSNPRGTLIKVVNFDMTDEFGRNFAFASQDITDRTAAITIDYADGTIETFRVATASAFEAGQPVGIPLTVALEEIIGLERIVNEQVQFTEQQLLDSNFSPQNYSLDNTYGTMPETDLKGVPTGRDVITRIRRRQTSITQVPGQFRGRFWAILVSSATKELGDEINLDTTILRPRENYLIRFVTDDDGDGVFALEEAFYGSSDKLVDSDQDGLGDRFEIREGWLVPGEINDRRVYPSPTFEDADQDKLSDTFERLVRTDPQARDTDGDLLSDSDEVYGNTPTLTGDDTNQFNLKSGVDLQINRIARATPVEVGAGPKGIAASKDHIWVVRRDSAQVLKLENNGTIVDAFDASDPDNVPDVQPVDVIFDGSTPWVLLQDTAPAPITSPSKLLRYRATDGELLQTVTIDRRLARLYWVDGAIWSIGENYLVRVDSVSGITDEFDLGGQLADLTFDGTDLWVSRLSGMVSRVRIDGTVIESADLGAGTFPQGLEYHDGVIWVCNSGDASVSYFPVDDPDDVNTISSIGTAPVDVEEHNGDIFVATQVEETITRIDPATRSLVGTITAFDGIGPLPYRLASIGQELWALEIGGASRVTTNEYAIPGSGPHTYSMVDFRFGTKLFERVVVPYAAGIGEPLLAIDEVTGGPYPFPVSGDDVATDSPDLLWANRIADPPGELDQAVLVLPGPNGLLDTDVGDKDVLIGATPPRNNCDVDVDCWKQRVAHTAHPFPYWTDPTDADTDDDGIVDGAERFLLNGNPNDPRDASGLLDADNDGLIDAREIAGWVIQADLSFGIPIQSDPNDSDSDDDGLPDVIEEAWGSNPRLADSDGDRISDYQEFDPEDPFMTQGSKASAIHDAIAAYNQARAAANMGPFVPHPNPSASSPVKADQDEDGLDDLVERIEGWTVSIDHGPPAYVAKSNPNNPNSDNDGWSDLTERENGTDPKLGDTDADGTNDDAEDTLAVGVLGRSRSPLRPDQLVEVTYRLLLEPGHSDGGDCEGAGPGEFSWVFALQLNENDWIEADCSGARLGDDNGSQAPEGTESIVDPVQFVHWFADPATNNPGIAFHAWVSEYNQEPLQSTDPWRFCPRLLNPFVHSGNGDLPRATTDLMTGPFAGLDAPTENGQSAPMTKLGAVSSSQPQGMPRVFENIIVVSDEDCGFRIQVSIDAE